MKGIKGTTDYYLSGLVNYTTPIGQPPNKGKVLVWCSDRYQRGGDYQPYQVLVSEDVARRAGLAGGLETARPRRRETMKIGDTVTITTPYGILPGTHRGVITKSIGPWWVLSVWVAWRGRHEEVCFSPEQVVADGTPTTDLSLGAMRRHQTALSQAQAEHSTWES